MPNTGLAAAHPTVCDHTKHGVLAVKICRYLRAAAIRHTAVVRAFRAHSANNTFWEREKDTIISVREDRPFLSVDKFKRAKATTNSWKWKLKCALLCSLLFCKQVQPAWCRNGWELYIGLQYKWFWQYLLFTAFLFSSSSLNPCSCLKAAGQTNL